MLRCEQLIGANFSFQHHPSNGLPGNFARWVSNAWSFGDSPHLDLFHGSPARLAELRSILGDNGISVHCFTPEQVLYPVNIARATGSIARRVWIASCVQLISVPNWARAISFDARSWL